MTLVLCSFPIFFFILPVLDTKTSFLHRRSVSTHVDLMQEIPPCESLWALGQLHPISGANGWETDFLDPDIIVEFNKTGLRREPRPFAKAAPLRKATEGPPAHHSSQQTNMGSESLLPLPCKMLKGVSKGHTEKSPRGSVSPKPSSWRH